MTSGAGDIGSRLPVQEARLVMAAARTPVDMAEMVRRRLAGEPLAHVVGFTEFCGIQVRVETDVFIPRGRTEFLVRRSVDLAPPHAVVVDMCCGSGAVGAAFAAQTEYAELHAVDIDERALSCAKQNLPEGAHIHRGDLYDALPPSLRNRIDLLIVNAPYVPTNAIPLMPPSARLHEPRVALDGGTDGLNIARRVAMAAPLWLAPSGRLLMETSRHQASRLVDIFRAAELRARVSFGPQHNATVVIGSLLADGASEDDQEPALT
jgi:release factor glutamine methyltransferase